MVLGASFPTLAPLSVQVSGSFLVRWDSWSVARSTARVVTTTNLIPANWTRLGTCLRPQNPNGIRTTIKPETEHAVPVF